jgi:hypothetical protein
MIIVQLKGGLGNQMFQYAAGLSLAAHHRTKVKVDISLLNQSDAEIGTVRYFDLQQLILSPEVATKEEISDVIYRNSFAGLLDKLQLPFKRRIYKEADYIFDTNYFKAQHNVYLKGYRQSEKYFAPIADKIRNGFQFKSEVVEDVQAKASELRAINSVSIHIRRGDYSNTIVRDYHGILEKDYYQKAIDHVQTTVPNCSFYIFSDDAEWVNSNLVFTTPFEIISGRSTKTHFEDFYLISQCKHQIIANSTFSWWAAWLNPNRAKIVIAPKKWFNKAPYDTTDLIPENWIKM